jgi:hypothetical protein
VANWNLSVDMRGSGDDLARALRESAREARNLATATRDARTQVRSLDTSSQAAASQVNRLGAAASGAQRNLLRMARQANVAAQDLREVARAADAADARLRAMGGNVRVRAHLDADTGAGAAAVRAAIADLSRLGPVRIGVQFDADTTQLAAIGLTATAALADIQNQAQDTSRALLLLAARARRTARELDDLATRARAAATGVRSLGSAARTASGNLGDLSTSSRTLRGDLDDLDGTVTRLSGNLGGLRGSLGHTSGAARNASGSMRSLLVTAGLLATGIIPIAASLVPIAAGLAAAGAAAGAFGVAIGGQIATLVEAGEAQEKYDDAVREHGKSSEQAVAAEKEYMRQLEEMPQATREAAAAVSVLKDEYKEWSNALADDTMPIAIKSMGLMQALLPKLTPLVRGTSDEFEHMLDVLAGASQTQGFDGLMDRFAEFAGETLSKATSGMVRFSQALDTGEIGGDWREFMDYAREVAPQVGDTLSELATTMLHLLVAGSDLGVSVLQLVEAFAALVNAVPPEVLSMLLQFYAATKLVALGAAGLAAVTGGAAAARLAAYFTVMRAAGVATTLRATAASMSMMTKAAIGLGVLAAAAVGINKLAENARGAPPDVDRLTTSLKELAITGKMTGELKKTFGDFDGLIDKMKKLRVETERASDANEGFVIPGIEQFSDWIGDVGNDLFKGEESFKALKEDFKGVDEALAQLASSGNAASAAEGFDLIRRAGKEAGYSTKEINDLLPEYQAAVASLKVEQQLAAAGMGLFGQQAIATKGKLDAQRASADGLRGAIQALNDVNRQALGGMIGFEAAIDAAAKAAAENAGALNMVNGQLDLNDPKAQAAATALQELATKTDEAAAAARASGASWGEVNAIYDRGRAELVKYAQQMGLSETQANALATSILGIPADKDITIEMIREDALAGLDQVIAKIKATPGSKSVTVDALTAEAMRLLNSLGFRTETLPDGRVTVTALTGSALANIGAVQNARDRLSDKTITITTNYVVTGNQARRSGAHGTQLGNADGSITDYYADGGIRAGEVKHFANGSENHIAQIAPAGAMRVWAEPETMGEGYVPFAPSKRPRSRAITEEIVRRLDGDPSAFHWIANGNLNDWSGHQAFNPLAAHQRRQTFPILREAARRMSVGLTDVSANRQVVIVKEGDTTTINVPAVRTEASASDIGAQVGRSYRRATRGGVKTRA